MFKTFKTSISSQQYCLLNDANTDLIMTKSYLLSAILTAEPNRAGINMRIQLDSIYMNESPDSPQVWSTFIHFIIWAIVIPWNLLIHPNFNIFGNQASSFDCTSGFLVRHLILHHELRTWNNKIFSNAKFSEKSRRDNGKSKWNLEKTIRKIKWNS